MSPRVRRRLLVGLVAAVLVWAAGVAAYVQMHSHHDFTAPSEANHPLTGATSAPGNTTWTPWPQALHDAQHQGASDVVGPQTGHVRWSRDLGGNVTPGPVIAADGTIYAATNGGVLYALDPMDGSTIWRLDGGGGYGYDLSTSPAVLPDGVILWPGPRDGLLAVSPAGELLWTLPFDAQPTSPAVLPDGEVVVGDTSGATVRLRPDADGPHVDWRFDAGDSSYGSVVLSADGTTAYQSLTSGVVAVRDGHQLWRSSPASDIIEVSPAVAADGTVVIGTNEPYEYGLDPTDGSVRWRYRKDYTTYSSASTTADGLVYFGDHRDRIAGLDAATGELRYLFNGDRTDTGPGGVGIWTSVLVDAHHDVYVGTRQGFVYGAAADGTLLWSLRVAATVDSYPALTADGALVIGTTDGRLLVVADQ